MAAERYLCQLSAEALTRHIDTALDVTGLNDSARAAANASHARLAESGDEW